MPNLLILLCVVAAVILAGLSARHYTAVRKKLRPLLPPDIRDASAKRIGLDIVIWSRLVPLQAKRDYLLRLIYGCAGGALLTLAFVLGDRSGFALFTGILTTAGAIQLVISLWKYRQAAGEKATGHADADS